MEWKSVDSQGDLDDLDQQVCWEDSTTLEYYATVANEPYFPTDVSRSGYLRKNIHVLCEVCPTRAGYLEIVLIDCDRFDSSFIENMFMRGRVDHLKRIDIVDYQGNLCMRCSRLIYRFLELVDWSVEKTYFRHADSVS